MTTPGEEEWYVRRGSAVLGPYSLEQFHRYLLLGRIRLTDRVSSDGETWHRVTQCPDLIPEDMRDLGSEAGLARFEAARQAVDQRATYDDDLKVVGGGRSEDPVPTATGKPLSAGSILVLLVSVAVLLTALWWFR